MVQQALQQLATIGTADWVAILSGAGYAVLAVWRIRWCWLAGAISSAVLVYVAKRSQLPMQALLQVFYVAMAAYGFWHWSRTEAQASDAQGTDTHDGGRSAATNGLLITRWPLHWHAALLMTLGVLAWFGGPSLARFTQGSWPRLDTLVMLASLLATWMTAQGKLENWFYWIAIDSASIYLYFTQGAAGAALLYLLYVAIAIAGAWSWSRLYLLQQRAAQQ